MLVKAITIFDLQKKERKRGEERGKGKGRGGGRKGDGERGVKGKGEREGKIKIYLRPFRTLRM